MTAIKNVDGLSASAHLHNFIFRAPSVDALRHRQRILGDTRSSVILGSSG